MAVETPSTTPHTSTTDNPQVQSAARISVLDLVERAAASEDPVLQRAAARVRARLSGLHLSQPHHLAARHGTPPPTEYVDLAPVVRDACDLLLHPTTLDCRDAPLMVRGCPDALRHAIVTLLTTLESGAPTEPLAVGVSVATGTNSLGAQAAQVQLQAVAPGALLGARAMARLTAALAMTLPGRPVALLEVTGDLLVASAPRLEARCDAGGVSVWVAWPVDLG